MENVTFGFYTLASTEEKKSKDGKRMAHVRCACGKEEYKLLYHLRIGRCTSCKSCASKRTSVNHKPPVKRKGCGGLSGTHFNAIKFGATRRGIAFNLTPEYMWSIYTGSCALTGVPTTLVPKIKNSNVDWDAITASLDRKDNSKGYEEGNVWWVHKEVNRLKNNYKLDDLYKWCELLLSERDRQS